jgi:hypothetical protein
MRSALSLVSVGCLPSDGQSWVRQCGSSSWTPQSEYFATWLPVPCTSTDGCFIEVSDTTLAKDTIDSWVLQPGGVDTLTDVTPTFANTGWLPQYFVLDSGVTSLARVRNGPLQNDVDPASRMANLVARQRAIRRFRAARVPIRAKRPPPVA